MYINMSDGCRWIQIHPAIPDPRVTEIRLLQIWNLGPFRSFLLIFRLAITNLSCWFNCTGKWQLSNGSLTPRRDEDTRCHVRKSRKNVLTDGLMDEWLDALQIYEPRKNITIL